MRLTIKSKSILCGLIIVLSFLGLSASIRKREFWPLMRTTREYLPSSIIIGAKCLNNDMKKAAKQNRFKMGISTKPIVSSDHYKLFEFQFGNTVASNDYIFWKNNIIYLAKVKHIEKKGRTIDSITDSFNLFNLKADSVYIYKLGRIYSHYMRFVGKEYYAGIKDSVLCFKLNYFNPTPNTKSSEDHINFKFIYLNDKYGIVRMKCEHDCYSLTYDFIDKGQ
jgi:hypothetical protein